MPDIAQMTSELRSLPDQAIQSELQNPSGLVPSYLVLAEAQRRQLMRQAAQKQQAQGQSGSVLDDVVRNMMAGQPAQGGPPAPAGMTPPRQGPAPMPGAAPPQQMGMARGGTIRMADGGDPGAPPGGWQGDPSEDDDIVEMPTTTVPRGPRLPGVMSPSNVDDWVSKYSQQYNVDPNLARAVMRSESGGRQGARSDKGATGLFQLMPGTAKDLGVDPRDPEQNVAGGIHYLRNMLDRYQGDVPKALAAYNAGPGAVDKYGGIPPFGETRAYVPRVQNIYNQLSRSSPNVMASANAGRYTPDKGYWINTDTPPVQQQQETKSEPSPQPDESDDESDAAPTPAPTPTPTPTPAAPTGSAAAPPTAAPAVIPSAAPYDSFSAENIAKQRQVLDSLGLAPDPGLKQMRAATIQQLQGLQQEVLQRYHNPSPWEFLSNIAAGMGASHQLSLPMMFGQGVGLAWQARDQQQQQQLTDFDSLQQRIDALQNVGETERERTGRDMITMLTRPNAGQQEFQKFLGLPNAIYGQQGTPPGAGFAFKPDPTTPGWGVWIDTAAPLKPQKAGPREQQVFEGAVKSIAQQYGLPGSTSYENLPPSIKLTAPIKLSQPMPQADGSVLAAGTVLPVGTTVYPQHEAELLADRSKSEQQAQTTMKRVTATVDGRKQLAADPDFMPGATDDQKQYYIRTGKQPENIDSLASAVANYDIDLKSAMARGAISDRNALVAKVMQINPHYNLGDQEAQYKGFQGTEKAFTGGKEAGRIQTTATLVHHLGQLYDAASALPTGDFRTLNKIAREVNAQVGATPQDTYNAIVHAVGPETTKAYIASGGTYQDREEVEKDFSPDLPPVALQRNVAARAKLLGGVMTPLVQQYVNGTYGRGTRHLGFYSPQTIGELNRIAPTAIQSMPRAQMQQFANQYTNGDFGLAQKHFADAGIFLAP